MYSYVQSACASFFSRNICPGLITPVTLPVSAPARPNSQMHEILP